MCSSDLVSTDGGDSAVWAADGRKLFYRSGDKMMAATIETGPVFAVSNIEELFKRRFLSRIDYRSYDVTRDGRFLMIQEPREPVRLGIKVVLNWFEELRQIAPAQTD